MDVKEVKTEENSGAYTCHKKSKGKLVREHLEKYGSITSLEAIELYGATRVADIIYKLRNSGVEIETVDMPFTDRFGTKSHYGKYVLKQ